MKLGSLDQINYTNPWHMIISDELTPSDFSAVARCNQDSCMLNT